MLFYKSMFSLYCALFVLVSKVNVSIFIQQKIDVYKHSLADARCQMPHSPAGLEFRPISSPYRFKTEVCVYSIRNAYLTQKSNHIRNINL